MSYHAILQAATQPHQRALMQVPFIQHALAGQVTLAGYTAFLTQAYHHVKHTAPLLMAAGARLSGEYAGLRRSVAEYIDEEIGHDEWILNDLRACGVDPEQVRAGEPGRPIELMVAYLYDAIARRHPLSIFGMVQVLEGTSIKAATPAAKAIQRSLGLPDQAFSYLISHGDLDQDHYAFFTKLMDGISQPADQALVTHVAQVVYELYTEMFRQLPLKTA